MNGATMTVDRVANAMPTKKPADLKEAVALELREQIEQHGLQYLTIADETGISRTTLYRILWAKKSPSIEELALITARWGSDPAIVLRNALNRLQRG